MIQLLVLVEHLRVHFLHLQVSSVPTQFAYFIKRNALEVRVRNKQARDAFLSGSYFSIVVYSRKSEKISLSANVALKKVSYEEVVVWVRH